MSFFRPERNINGEEVNAERFPVRAAQREAALRERVMMDILERHRKINNNNNNNNNNISSRPNSEMNNMSGINAERFPNNVSEREAELRVRALTEAERANKPEMGPYMFNREAADERYSQNVMNSIIRLLPKRAALEAKEHALREKHVNNAERNEERLRLRREKSARYLASIEYIRARERYLAAEAARRAEEAARRAEEARLAEEARSAQEARLAAEAEENARRQTIQNFLYAQALRPEPPGLRRANATIEGVPGRRNYKPGRRKSRKPRKNNNKTRRR